MTSAKEYVFAAVLCGVLPYCLYAIWDIHDHSQKIIRENVTQYVLPSASDMWISLFVMLALTIMRIALTSTFLQWLGNKMVHRKWPSEAVRDEQIKRFAVVAFKFLYFVIITSYGFYILKDEDYLPSILGGSGFTVQCWIGWPYQDMSPINMYYLIQLGYHLHSLAFQVATGIHRRDFLEMVLHHTCAVFLIVFSYLLNITRVGCLVLLVHDIADIVGYQMKMVVDTNNKKIILASYLELLAVWIWSRLYIYPFVVIYSVAYEGVEVLGYYKGYHVLVFMLCTLQAMHVYWFVLFLVMGAKFLTSGKAEDIQDKLKKDNPKKTN